MTISRTIAGALAFAAFFGSPAIAETLTIDSIVALSGAGLGDDAVIAKIRAANVPFDLTTDQMIMLKGKGVSGPVIAAMLSPGGSAPRAPVFSMDSPDPMVPHITGVYLFDEKSPKMTRIDATISNQAKTGGIFGYALTGGIASMSVKAAIQNQAAKVRTGDTTPTFYFFFDESNPDARQASNWLSGTAATVTSPNEFTLIRLEAKDGRREARVGSMNIGGAKSGVMDKDRRSFTYEMVRPGVYKISVDKALPLGEYGFIFSITGAGTNGALTARIFDFGVS